MASEFAFRWEIITGEFQRKFDALSIPIAVAATETMDIAAARIKGFGRSSIASAGFSRRWQNALRVDRYPKAGISMRAAVHIYHRIGYAGVFEEGAVISGSPFLWLPLPTAPLRVGRRKTTPRNIGLPLVFFRGKRGTPLLGVRTRVPRGGGPMGRMTMSKLKRGAKGKSGVLRTVPLFHGIQTSTINKKFQITEIVEEMARQLASIYVSQLRPPPA